MAILDLQSKIIESLEKKEIPCAIFLDFAKAFDTVNHEILLKKLEHYGIRERTLDWFKTYLSGRKQCVSINDVNSSLMEIKHGVPQGSVLGPLLFLISINDIIFSSDVFDFFLFADDTSLFYSGKSTESIEPIINCELEKLSAWLTANKLTLNTDKSNVLLFRPINASNNITLSIKINEKQIAEKMHAKYLGVIIDNKLTFSSHISKICQKLTKGNYILAKLRHFVPNKVLKNIYNAYIQPFLDYGILVWSVASKTNMEAISKLHDKSLRIINFKKINDSATPLYKESKILSLNSIVKYSQSKFFWKMKNGYLPSVTNEIFKTQNVSVNLRNPDRYVLPYKRLEIGQKFLTYSGIETWNELPNGLINKTTMNAFKESYNEYVFGQQN